MHKLTQKIPALALSAMMMASIALPASAAVTISPNALGPDGSEANLSTDVKYSSSMDEMCDIDDNGTDDIHLDGDVTFGIMVPEDVVIDADAENAYIGGYTDTSVTLKVDNDVRMTQNEVAANKLTADMTMGELTGEAENTLTLPYNVVEQGHVNAPVSSAWDDADDEDGIDTKPLIGTWAGVTNYNVTVAPQVAE